MEMEETLDEILDLKQNLPEIYSFDQQYFSDSDYGSRKSANKKQSISWNSSYVEEIISTQPSSSSAASPPQLISFENSKFSSYVPTDIDTDYNSSNLDMAKDYSLTSQIITFSSSHKDDFGSNNHYHDSANVMTSQKKLSTATRTPLQALDHLMAERKRRDNLRQLFISLSKIVPGLKKLDKASLLEDATDYLKALQERVRFLEEEEIKNRSIDTSKQEYSSSNKGRIESESSATEIHARISNKHVFVKIFCKKKMGLMSRIPGEMEKIHLSVVDIRIMPFGEIGLDITILAEMLSEFRGTVKDIVGQLRQAGFLEPA